MSVSSAATLYMKEQLFQHTTKTVTGMPRGALVRR